MSTVSAAFPPQNSEATTTARKARRRQPILARDPLMLASALRKRIHASQIVLSDDADSTAVPHTAQISDSALEQVEHLIEQAALEAERHFERQLPNTERATLHWSDVKAYVRQVLSPQDAGVFIARMKAPEGFFNEWEKEQKALRAAKAAAKQAAEAADE